MIQLRMAWLLLLLLSLFSFAFNGVAAPSDSSDLAEYDSVTKKYKNYNPPSGVVDNLQKLPLDLESEKKALDSTIRDMEKVDPELYKIGTTPLHEFLAKSVRPTLTTVCSSGTRWICFKNVKTPDGQSIETAIFGVCEDPGDSPEVECVRVY